MRAPAPRQERDFQPTKQTSFYEKEIQAEVSEEEISTVNIQIQAEDQNEKWERQEILY